jgi:hypothetical protein
MACVIKQSAVTQAIEFLVAKAARLLKNALADDHQHKRGGRQRSDGEKKLA